jgi:hypothetical protein
MYLFRLVVASCVLRLAATTRGPITSEHSHSSHLRATISNLSEEKNTCPKEHHNTSSTYMDLHNINTTYNIPTYHTVDTARF